MGWPTPGCKTALAAAGLPPCPQAHCDDIGNYLHNFCACKIPPILNPCPFNADSPIATYDKQGNLCGCCCMCFAWGTPIAVPTSAISPEGFKPIEQFAVGDPVMVADADLNWYSLPVEYSNGTGTDAFLNLLLAVGYELGGEPQSLLVTPNNLFLMPDGKLKRADRLVPGTDRLVLADKTTTPVKALAVGRYKKGVHHIATSLTTATSVDGHLLNAHGVVSADYALQIAGIDQLDGRVEPAAASHEFGTPEYGEHHRHLVRDRFHAAVEGFDLAAAVPKDFELLANAMTQVPEGAHRFISQRQADAIEHDPMAPRYPPSSSIGIDYTHYLFTIYGGFFPTVRFLIDPSNTSPNAYSFREGPGKDDVCYVIVSGGLLRMKALKMEAISAVVAHELGHLFGGDPLNRSHYTCEGAADYVGMGSIMRAAWYGSLYGMTASALEQLTEFLGYLKPDVTPPEPGDRCDDISIDCRLEAMRAAMGMNPLPYCAGGELQPFLRLLGAAAADEKGGPVITLTFNTEVLPGTGNNAENYALAPPVAITGAQVDETDGKLIRVTAPIESGTEYTITVSNLLSTKDQILIDGADKATFTMKAAR